MLWSVINQTLVLLGTSGKNLGMGAAKSNRNGNVGEFRHMTTSFFSSCEKTLLVDLGPGFIIEQQLSYDDI